MLEASPPRLVVQFEIAERVGQDLGHPHKVAAILVASIRLHFSDVVLNAETRGLTVFPCNVHVRKGEELGWFEHGSTIIVLAPDDFEFCDAVLESARIDAGQPLMSKRPCSGVNPEYAQERSTPRS